MSVASIRALKVQSLEMPSLEETVAQHIDHYFAAHHGALPPRGLYERILPLVERPLILQALQATSGNQLKAAELLGINRNTLRKRMKELGITCRR